MSATAWRKEPPDEEGWWWRDANEPDKHAMLWLKSYRGGLNVATITLGPNIHYVAQMTGRKWVQENFGHLIIDDIKNYDDERIEWQKVEGPKP